MDENPSDLLPLPHLSLHVLLALAEGEGHGWAIIRRIEELTQGVWSPSAGSLYLAMVKLEKTGLIEEVDGPPDATDARRRYYRLTASGNQVLAAEMERLASIVARGRAAGVTA